MFLIISVTFTFFFFYVACIVCKNVSPSELCRSCLGFSLVACVMVAWYSAQKGGGKMAFGIMVTYSLCSFETFFGDISAQ